MPIKKVKSKRFKNGYGFRLTIDRKDLRFERTFETEKKAREVEAAITNRQLSEGLGIPHNSSVPLKHLIAEHLEAIRGRVHYASIKVILERFAAIVGTDRPVQSLKKADLMNYVKHRQREKKTPQPQTINREMTEIKAMLNAAWKHFPELDEYQSPKVSRLPVGDVSRSQTWSEEDLIALLKVLLAPAAPFEYDEIVDQRRKLAEMLIVARLTGMRPGEVRRLNRFQIDFKKEIINVTSLKGGKPKKRVVPMCQEVAEILARRAQLGEWIFSNPTGDKPMTEPYKLLRTACRRAGVAYGMKVTGGKVLNDTRRTFENEALEAGHQPVAVAKTLGHSVNTMVKHYLRTTSDQLRAVVNSGKNYRGIFGVTTIETEATEAMEESESAPKSLKKQRNSKNKGSF